MRFTPAYRQAGQMMWPLILLLALSTSTFVMLIRSSQSLQSRTDLQIAADMVAISSCRLQARALNAIAILNSGLHRLDQVANLILTTWSALTACAASCSFGVGCACAVPLARFSQLAPRLLRRIEAIGKQVAVIQQEILSTTPMLITTQAILLARENGADFAAVTALPQLPLVRLAARRYLSIRLPGELNLSESPGELPPLSIRANRRISTDANVQFSYAQARLWRRHPADMKDKTLRQPNWDATLTDASK